MHQIRTSMAAMACLFAAPVWAAPPDAKACQEAIAAVERRAAVPPQLLSAIARVESGRPAGGGVVAWPWTLNAAGTGYFYASAAEAIAAITTFRAGGIQSIDVGCMQVNLQHHPAAFPSLQDALDPVTNVTYAARFLTQLNGELGNWPQAAAAYHSRTPERAAVYGRRVMQAWPLAMAYGGGAMLAGSAPAPEPLVVVDPYGVYTPAFTRRLAADAAVRATRGVTAAAPARRPSSVLAQRFPSQLRVQVARSRGVRFAQSEPLGTTTVRRP